MLEDYKDQGRRGREMPLKNQEPEGLLWRRAGRKGGRGYKQGKSHYLRFFSVHPSLLGCISFTPFPFTPATQKHAVF